MKFFLLSDAHLGKYSSDSDRWLNLMRSYFFDFFIPFIKKNAKSTDKFFFLGDLFDNRTSIDMRALTLAVEIFEELSKIIECHVLLGNHDQRMMNDPTINSIVTIRNIPNVITYSKESVLEIDGHKILILPWIHGKNSEKEIMEKHKNCDMLLCHSDLNGCRTQLYPTRPINRNILDIEDFSGFSKVYSGHIHIVQTIKNFTFVGSPYHLDRNDVWNKKGIWVYDTKKKQDVFIENEFSPEFIKHKILKSEDLSILNDLLQTNNFIDVEISKNLFLNEPNLRLEFDKLSNKYRIENIDYIDDIEVNSIEKKQPSYVKGLTIKEASEAWCDRIKINIDTDLFTEIEFRQNMKKTIENCYNILNAEKK